jgi:hypothetical protein
MPMTVKASPPSNEMARPMMDRSLAKRRRQKLSLSTTASGCAVGSSGRNVRPWIGVTPKTSKYCGVTVCDEIISGVPSAPINVGPPPAAGIQIAAIVSKVRFCAVHSSKLSSSMRLRPPCCGPCSSMNTRRSLFA